MSQKEGYCKGAVLADNMDYVKNSVGEGGLSKLMRYMRDIGYDISEIDRNRWYPLEMRVAFLKAIKEIFQWGDEDIEKMGEEGSRSEMKIGFLLKYLASPEIILKSAEKIWREYYTVGNMKLMHLDGNSAVLRLTDFDYDPIMCVYLRGFFRSLKPILRVDSLSVRETVCTHKGGDFHEFVIEW